MNISHIKSNPIHNPSTTKTHNTRPIKSKTNAYTYKEGPDEISTNETAMTSLKRVPVNKPSLAFTGPRIVVSYYIS